jgi:hypothetical protein
MRNQQTQRQRTKNNPLSLGTFSQTSLRLLKGTLGPKSQVIGQADTWDTSNGGYGGGTYNHWFKINITADAWMLIVKGAPRPKYINVSVYDLNQNPIESRNIFDKDSIAVTTNDTTSYPYVGHTMNAQSALYNNFNGNFVDKGDNRYFILPAGFYLLCISTTRNEPLDYSVGLVLQFSDSNSSYLLETGVENYLVFESASSPVTLLDPVNYIYFDLFSNRGINMQKNEHSLSEWKAAWEREHQEDDRFPAIFATIATTS